jgi:hypothetical protein
MTTLKGKCRVILSHASNPDIEGGYWGSRPDKGEISEPVKTLAEASKVCRRYITENDLGGGNWTGGKVVCNGKAVARVSYNGKVWALDGSRLAGVRRRRRAR